MSTKGNKLSKRNVGSSKRRKVGRNEKRNKGKMRPKGLRGESKRRTKEGDGEGTRS